MTAWRSSVTVTPAMTMSLLPFWAASRAASKSMSSTCQLQAQLLGDGVSHLDVDALEAAVVGDHFIGRERRRWWTW